MKSQRMGAAGMIVILVGNRQLRQGQSHTHTVIPHFVNISLQSNLLLYSYLYYYCIPLRFTFLFRLSQI